MSKAIVQAGQTITDIALQYLGAEQAVYALAQLNALDVTEILVPGQELVLPAVQDKRTRRVFEDGGYVPATKTDTLSEGIDYMGIEVDFIVE